MPRTGQGARQLYVTQLGERDATIPDGLALDAKSFRENGQSRSVRGTSQPHETGHFQPAQDGCHHRRNASPNAETHFRIASETPELYHGKTSQNEIKLTPFHTDPNSQGDEVTMKFATKNKESHARGLAKMHAEAGSHAGLCRIAHDTEKGKKEIKLDDVLDGEVSPIGIACRRWRFSLP